MNTSLSWIKAYVPGLDCTAQEYTDAMTLSGTKVEGYTCLDADLDKIVIGQIKQIDPHPDADKLIICQVDVGTETTQIVTGAPNVHVGDKVPVVLDGGKVAGGHDGKMMPGGVMIKKGKLRGRSITQRYRSACAHLLALQLFLGLFFALGSCFLIVKKSPYHKTVLLVWMCLSLLSSAFYLLGFLRHMRDRKVRKNRSMWPLHLVFTLLLAADIFLLQLLWKGNGFLLFVNPPCKDVFYS